MSNFKTWLLIIMSALVSYAVSIQYGFSQDDWFHLTISQANNFKEFLNFFNPFQVTWIFFRPISTQLPYWLSTSLFPLPLAPYFMHLMMIVIHICNGYLVVQIARKYLRPNLALVLGVIYTLSNIHFLSLFYIGAIQQLISTFFSLQAILLMLKKSPSQLLLALLVGLALLSKELAVRLPIILLFIAYYRERSLYKAVIHTAGPLIVVLGYFILRYFVGNISASEYQLSFSPATTLATIMWYGLFTLGFPEQILNFGLSGGLVDFPAFFSINSLSRLPILLATIPLLIVIVTKILSLLKSKANLEWVYLPTLSLVALAPIIFLPTHRYPHYLDLTLLFLGIWLLSEYRSLTRKGILVTLLISVGMISSIWVDLSTHWTIKRAIESKYQMDRLLDSDLCQSPTGLVYQGTKQEVLDISYALSLENGPRYICQNPRLKVQYLVSP